MWLLQTGGWIRHLVGCTIGAIAWCGPAYAESFQINFDEMRAPASLEEVPLDAGFGPDLFLPDLHLLGGLIVDTAAVGGATSGSNVYASCTTCLDGFFGQIIGNFDADVSAISLDVINGNDKPIIVTLVANTDEQTFFGGDPADWPTDSVELAPAGEPGAVQSLSVRADNLRTFYVSSDVPFDEPGTYAIDSLQYATECAPAVSCQEVVFETGGPRGSAGGDPPIEYPLVGPVILVEQPVSVEFHVDAEHALDRLTVWLMASAPSPAETPFVTISIRNGTDKTLELWSFHIHDDISFSPVPEVLESSLRPTLHPGETYLIVAESDLSFEVGVPHAVWPWSFPDEIPACSVEATLLGEVCAEDLDSDGDVGFTDLLVLLASWGEVGVEADFDGEGVGFSDLLALLAAWGPCA